MNRLSAAALPLLLAFAGCATGPTVAQAEVALTAAETAALAYVTQPACVGAPASSLCPNASTVAQIKAADTLAYTAVKGAEAGTVTPAAAMTAIASLSALIPAAK